MKFPIINKGITLSEIPGHISVFFEFGGCKQNCKNCHSAEWNSVAIARDLYTEMAEMVRYASKLKEGGANAIILMGGTNNVGVTPPDLFKLIEVLSKVMPVGLYSGLPHTTNIHKALFKSKLTWLKTGEYIEELGGLTSSTTNQRIYQQIGYDFTLWQDITEEFRNEGDNE